jgi:hypothetical protein
MHRNSVAKPETGKSCPVYYRVGQFVITRVRSRWRIRARDSAPDEGFSTLGGAVAWCRQHSESPLPDVRRLPAELIAFVFQDISRPH